MSEELFKIDRDLFDEEKKEIHDVYEKWAKQGLIDCKGMSESEENEYIKRIDSKIIEELKVIKEKYDIKYGNTQ